MILWMDFVLLDDSKLDFFGPLLASFESQRDDSRSGAGSENKCREKRFGSVDSRVREDAVGKNGTLDGVPIQETGQEQRLARMAGLSNLDSARSGMEAGSARQTSTSRQRERE